MIHQAKVLKTALKKIGATRNKKPNLSVRTERTLVDRTESGKAIYEYGSAVCHTDALTPEQIKALKEELKYVEIYNNVEHDFAVIKN